MIPRHLTIYLAQRTVCGDGLSIPTRALYQDYRLWCARTGVPALVRKAFGRVLRPVWQPETGTTIVQGRALTELDGRVTLLALRPGLTADDVVALELVANELARQRTAEGHSADWDAAYPLGLLEAAGGEYLFHAGYHRRDDFPPGQPSDSWPWSAEHWKPKDPMRDATRGCALGVAGIARRLRPAMEG